MLIGLHSFLSFLLRILSLHTHGACLLLFEIANEIGIVCILNRSARVRHLASRSSLLRCAER